MSAIQSDILANKCVWAYLGVCGRGRKRDSEPPHASYSQKAGKEIRKKKPHRQEMFKIHIMKEAALLIQFKDATQLRE
jgi:hypothetical protein